MNAATFDPVMLEVIRNGALSTCDEMHRVLMGAARSPILKEAGDLSCALTNARGEVVAQGRNLPIHLGVMAATVKEFLRVVPEHVLVPGTTYVTNLLHIGGNHLPDVKAITPLYVNERLVAFAINLAHWPDIGGAVAGGYSTSARDLMAEGLQIPPVPLFRDGQVDESLMAMITANVRGPEDRRGDVYAQFASNFAAQRRVVELCERFGAESVVDYFGVILDEGETLMRKAIGTIGRGSFAGEDFLDDDGSGGPPTRIHVRVDVAEDRLHFDFTGTDAPVIGALNTTRFVTESACYYACKALFGGAVPDNAGAYRPISVYIPDGTLLSVRDRHPVALGNLETAMRVVDAIFRALAAALPDRVSAGCFSSAGPISLSGQDADGRFFLFRESHGGGGGAFSDRDGFSGIRNHTGNTMNTPTEVIELTYPLRVCRLELIPDSGGSGKYRGGLGLRREIEVLGETAALTAILERHVTEPWGLEQGLPGRRSGLTVETSDGTIRRLPGKVTSEPLRRGDRIVLETSGGGGFGDARERSPEAVRRDEVGGYVTQREAVTS